MPRKSKKSNDPEAAAQVAPTAEETQVPHETPAPTKKTTRKKRTTRAAGEEAAPAPQSSSDPGLEKDAEATAHAAETFDDAFESNDPAEAHAHALEVADAQTAAAQEPAADAEPEPSHADDEGEPEFEREPAKLERLQKILAQAGVASRRHAEELITEGRVQVNGQVVTTLGSKADPTRDHIRVDGKLLQGAERLRYFMLNKPRGYVTTVSDPEGRPTVMEFFAKMGERLYPVGRLDYLSEGLLLVTNDGELANKLTRAASGVEKTYLVKVSGQPTEEQMIELREGVSIDRGKPGEGRVRTAPARIREIRMGENPWFEVVLIEGRNRELRKMFEEIGHHVEKIRRVGYGPLILDVEPGKLRELDHEEIRALRLNAEGKWKPKRMKTTVMLPKEAGRTVDHEAAKSGRNKFGKKPFRPQQRRDEGRGEPREYRGGRAGEARGGERRPFPSGPRREAPGSGPGEQPRDVFIRRREEERGRPRPTEAGEQRRTDNRKPGRAWSGQRPLQGQRPAQGGERGQRHETNRGSAPARPQRSGFARNEGRSNRPPRGEWGGKREQTGRAAGRGPGRSEGHPPRRDQNQGPARGERREFSRPPREGAPRAERPAFRPTRLRIDEETNTRGARREGEERRFTGERPARPSGPAARPSRPGARPSAGGPRPPRAGGPNRSGFGRTSRPGPGSGSRPGSRPGSSGRGNNRGGGPKRRP